MPAIQYTFSASGVRTVTNAFRAVQLAAAQAARMVEVHDKKKAASAKKTANQTERSAIEASTAAIKALTKEITKIGQLESQIKKLTKTMKQRGAAASAASNKAVADTQKEIAAAKRLEVARRKAATSGLVGRARSFSGGTGLTGLGVTGVLMGGMVAGAATRNALELETAVAELALKGRRPGQAANINPLMRSIRATAIANPGVKSMDLTRGMMAYVSKTGDLPGAKSYMNTFATVGAGTGTNMEDLGRVMAEMQIKMGITDPTEMLQGLSMMAVAGKRNRIELSDLARYLPKVSAAQQRFSGRKGFDAVASLSGLIQVGAQGVGTAAEAATSMERFYTNVAQAQHTGYLEKLGVRAFREGSKSKFRNAEEILADILYTTDNRLTADATDPQGRRIKKADRKVALMDIFKARGIRFVSGFSQKWDELAAGRDRGGQARTIDETKAAFLKFIETLKQGTEAVNEIAEDHRIKQQTTAAKLTAAWEQVADQAAKSLLPMLSDLAKNPQVIKGFVTSMSGMMKAFAKLGQLTGFVVEQFTALGSYLATRFGGEDADAQRRASVPLLERKIAENLEQQEKEKKLLTGPRVSSGRLAALQADEKALRDKLTRAQGITPGLTSALLDPATGKPVMAGGSVVTQFDRPGLSRSQFVAKLVSMGMPKETAEKIASQTVQGVRGDMAGPFSKGGRGVPQDIAEELASPETTFGLPHTRVGHFLQSKKGQKSGFSSKAFKDAIQLFAETLLSAHQGKPLHTGERVGAMNEKAVVGPDGELQPTKVNLNPQSTTVTASVVNIQGPVSSSSAHPGGSPGSPGPQMTNPYGMSLLPP